MGFKKSFISAVSLSRWIGPESTSVARWSRPSTTRASKWERAEPTSSSLTGVVVELKAITALQDIHLAQAKNYVVAYGLDIGLLINFGATSLEWKRIFNDKQTG